MFSADRRRKLLGELVELARADVTVGAAALLGSEARRDTDAWSDIDLALVLAPDTDLLAAARSFGDRLSRHGEVADRLDVWSGPALYRVFLFADSLQVDLSFWPAGTFVSRGEPVDPLFGAMGVESAPSRADPREEIGWAWLYALHARSAIARGRRWQAVQMLDGLRDRTVALACLRHGLPAGQGRGVDRLPSSILASLSRARAAGPEPDELAGAFGAAVQLLLIEVQHVDPELAGRLRGPLTLMTHQAG